MRKCTSSRAKDSRCCKQNWVPDGFSDIMAAILVPLGRAQIWCLHTKLWKFVWEGSKNNLRMVHRTDLKLGEIVYLFIIYDNYLKFIASVVEWFWTFWLRDSENQQFLVCMWRHKILNSLLWGLLIFFSTLGWRWPRKKSLCKFCSVCRFKNTAFWIS